MALEVLLINFCNSKCLGQVPLATMKRFFRARTKHTYPTAQNIRRENRNDFNIRNEDALSVSSFHHNYHPFKYTSGCLVDKSVLNKKERMELFLVPTMII